MTSILVSIPITNSQDWAFFQEPCLRPTDSGEVYMTKEPRPGSHVSVFCSDDYTFSIHFSVYTPSVGGVGTMRLRNGSIALHHSYCDQNENPKTKMASPRIPFSSHELRLSWDDHTAKIVLELVKLADDMDIIHSHVKIYNSGAKSMESLFVPVNTLVAFCCIPILCQQQGFNEVTAKYFTGFIFDSFPKRPFYLKFCHVPWNIKNKIRKQYVDFCGAQFFNVISPIDNMAFKSPWLHVTRLNWVGS